MPAKPPTETEIQVITQLTRIAESLSSIAANLDSENRHSSVTEFLKHVDFIAQKHRSRNQ